MERGAVVRNIVRKRNNEFYGGNEREENNHLSDMCGNDFKLECVWWEC